MIRTLFPLVGTVALVGCEDLERAMNPQSAEPYDAPPVDEPMDDGDVDVGDDVDEPITGATRWRKFPSPCSDGWNASLLAEAGGDQWIACGEEGGLYLHRGASGEFRPVADPVLDGRTLHALAASDGVIYVAGDDGRELFVASIDRGPGNLELSVLTPPGGAMGFLQPSALAVDANGAIHVVDATGSRIATYDGLAWTITDDWLARPPSADPAATFLIHALDAGGDALLGVGTSPDGSPTLYWHGADRPASQFQLNARVFDQTNVRFEDTAVGREGSAIVVGGDEGNPLLLQCDQQCLRAASWQGTDFAAEGGPALAEGDGPLFRVARARNYVVAIGRTLGTAGMMEGYALLSDDGGATFTRVEEGFPELVDCAVDGRGLFSLIGVNRYFAVGRFAGGGGAVGDGGAAGEGGVAGEGGAEYP